MSWLTRLFFYRRGIYSDLAEELRQHLEEKTEYLMREGMSREDAEHAARRAFGNATLIEQRGREPWQWPRIENLLRDIRFSARLLRKSPGFAIVAILTLTLGVGANTAVFSLLNGLLLRPLPVPDANRLVLIRISPRISHGYSFSVPLFRLLETHHEVFSGVFAFYAHRSQIRGQNGNETISGEMVSGQFFAALAAPPELGRYLTPADDQKGNSEDPVVIGDDLWRTRFHRDPAIIGSKLVLDNVAFTIVGVMPKTFIGADAAHRHSELAPPFDLPLRNLAARSLDHALLADPSLSHRRDCFSHPRRARRIYRSAQGPSLGISS